MKTFCAAVGLFIGLIWQYLPEIGLEAAHGRVVATTHNPVFMILMGVSACLATHILYIHRDEIFNDNADEKGGREL